MKTALNRVRISHFPWQLVASSVLALTVALMSGSATALVTQDEPDEPGESSITEGTNWSDDTAPYSDETYESNKLLRASTTTTFQGDSLTMTTNKGILVFDADAITLTVPELHLVSAGRITLDSGSPAELLNVILDGKLHLDRDGNNSVADANLGAGESLTIASDIDGIGRLSVGADSGGEVLLSGANTFTGGVRIQFAGAILTQVNADSLPDGASNGDSVVEGILQLNHDGSVSGLEGGTDGEVNNVSGGDITFTFGRSTVSVDDPLTYSGVIDEGTGTMDVVKRGANQQILTGDNDYSNGTLIKDSGQLQIFGAAADLGSGDVTIQDTATLELNNVGTEINDIYLVGRDTPTPPTSDPAHIDNVGGINGLSGAIQLDPGGSNNFNINSSSGDLTISGGITASADNDNILNLGGAGTG